MKKSLVVLTLIAANPAFGEETRQLDAHEHGVGTLNIALEGTTVAMEFHAPGADIVGFEYGAKSDADHAAIDAALAKLGAPQGLFAFPDGAGCTVTSAKAELEGDEGHDHDAHDDEHHDDHKDGEHKDDEHAHDEHKDDHADHDDEKHDEHKHDEHDDHAEEEGSGHTEFHAEYMLTCDSPDALTSITFAYFDHFPNAKEVEVQIITASGAQAYEVERDDPMLKLEQ